jgi:hypothetical protein
MRVLIDRFHVGHGTQIGPITLFPVWTEARSVQHDVIPVQTLTVSELASPIISALHVESAHPLPLLLPEGTLLAGGMQTRVLARDVLLPANGSAEVPTNCVEQGRWASRGEHSIVGRAPLSVVAALRDLPRRSTSRQDRQSEVWAAVSRQEARYGNRPTSSLVDVMLDEQAMDRASEQELSALRLRHLTEQLAAYRPLRGQSGILIGVAGQPVLLEIFSSSRGFTRHLPQLLSGFALDVVDSPVIPTPSRRARRFAEAVMNTDLTTVSSDGISTHVTGSHEKADIRALQVRDSALHVVAINKIHDLTLAA